MALLSEFENNALFALEFNGTALSSVANFFVALYIASKGPWTASTAYSVGDTIIPSAAGNNHIYKCTTAGTSGSTAPTFPTSDGGTVTDGTTLVWTEQTPSIRAGTINEASGGGYARQAVPNTTAGWTISTTANNAKQSANAALISFGTLTANLGWVAAVVLFDASTAGNLRYIAEQMTPQNVVSGNTLEFNAGALVFTGN